MTDNIDIITTEDAARKLGIEPRRVKQLVRDRQLIAATGPDGTRGIVADSIVKGENGWEPLWNLPGTLTVLDDGGFTPEEALRWLFTPLEELDQTPMAALQAGRQRTVNSIAASLAL